jgi:hypothetical protein
LIGRQLGNRLGDFFDLHVAQYSRSGLGFAENSARLPRKKFAVPARGLSKLYLDDLTTNGGTCGRCHPNVTLTENAVPRTPRSNLPCFERSGPLLSRPSLKAFVR